VNLAISLLTVVSLNEPEAISTDVLSTCTVMLALLGGLIASLTMFFNPMNRWIRLKSAALSLESELWKFRTRTGIYKVDINSFNDRVSEERLYQFVEDVKRTVSMQVSLSPLTTQDLGHKKYFYHGQYEDVPDNSALQLQKRGANTWKKFESKDKPEVLYIGEEDSDDENGPLQQDGNTARQPDGEEESDDDQDEDDDHYSPLEPFQYLKYRVFPVLQNYRDRTPGYSRWYTVIEMLLIFCQLVGVVLGIFGKGSWTGVVASVSATVTSWAAMRGFQEKRERTSSAVETLDSLLLWWRFLQFFDRCNVENVDRLVNKCEDVFERQRDAWVSTSYSANVEIQGLLESAQARSSELNKQKQSAGIA